MRRSVREASLGFCLLVAIASGLGLWFWLRGISLGRQTWTMEASFQDAAGLAPRSPVSYRGVMVGSVQALKVTDTEVVAELTITDPKLRLALPVVARVAPSSLLGGDAAVSLLSGGRPLGPAMPGPKEAGCDRKRMVCQHNRIPGVTAASFDSVTETMQQLSMSGGCVEVALLTGQPSAFGLEEIEFRVSPHAGQSMQGLAKTASGGELSRLGLALQTVLSAVSAAPTLIFDEVDAGIGGSVAEIVGRLLAEQGRNRQVLCVTHLPQVAACAAWHYQVSKVSEGKQVRTQVKLLESEARVDEVARMLGGVKMTEATRKHAEEMLAGGR